MQDLLKSFGVEPVLLAAQIVNFLIILWLLKRFAYKPIFDVLEKRRKLVQEGVKNAEKSTLELEKALEEEKVILKKAQQESQTLLADAQKQAADLLTEAEASAKARVAKILEEAKQEIDRQTQETEKRLAAHTAQLAIELLEKSLQGMVDKKTQQAVLENASKKLKA